jgi:RNase adaptor protein for sRNA GlmZ degradation
MTSQNGSTSTLHVTVFSFGYKFGPPEDVNFLWDVRFLPNPYWVDSLRQRTGREKDVAEYAIGNAAGREFLSLIEPLLIFIIEQQALAKKGNLTIAVGCTGGRHRSVAVVEALRAMLAKQAVELDVFHRDIGKE